MSKKAKSIRSTLRSLHSAVSLSSLRKNIKTLRTVMKGEDASQTLTDLFLDQYPTTSRFAESYRTLRTSIHFSFMDKAFRSLLVTSAGAQEGKTSTVANLAYTMAQAGKTVLMIDADLRKPMLSTLLPSQNSTGLTELLSDVFGSDVRSGSLAEFSVSDLFWLLSFQQKTGLLRLTEGKEEVHVYFLQGKMSNIKWPTRPKDQKLVTLLMKNKLLTNEQAKLAIVRKKDTGQKMGFVLINMGFIKEDDLAGFIILHMMEGLRQFRSGEFSFKDLPESYFEGPSFDPADLPKVYRQVIIGEEELPYLQMKITAAITKTNVGNLFLLPSGSPPPNPAELLDSNRMSFLLSYLNRRFDRIILDSPPILPASDALLLAPQTDGVVLMVKAGHVNRNMIKKAIEQLQMSQANLIGTVLNQVDVKGYGYYKDYYKYYAEYYGEK
jgi:Mrp family chromosome partitioning ATPase